MEETRKKMKGKVVFKHETEADWLKSNYVPDKGEMVLYDEDDKYDYKRTKYGNGKDKVKDLPFSISTNLLESGEGENSIQQSNTGAKALGNNSIAFNNSIAGCKGYRYKAIDLKNRKIYLTESEIEHDYNDLDTDGRPRAKILFTTEGFTDEQVTLLIEDIKIPYRVGDEFTLKARSKDYDKVSKIAEKDRNVIIFEETSKLTSDEITWDIVTTNNDWRADRYSFSVPDRPLEGVKIISEVAVAFGINKTIGSYAFSAGYNNLSFGDMATTFGSDNSAGYQCFVAGVASHGKNGRNFTLGYKCTNEAMQAFVTGHGCYTTVDAENSVVGGFGNKATAPNQTIFGKHALQNSNILFGIGNGTSGNSSGLRNAFTVWKDGRATLAADPTGKMDAATKQYVDSKVISLSKGTGSYSTVTSGSNNKATKQATTALGCYCEANSKFSFATGLKSITSENVNGQAVVGRYNKIDDSAIFIVGNGDGNTGKTSNAFVAKTNGQVVGGKSTATNDEALTLVTKDYVDNQLNSIAGTWDYVIDEVEDFTQETLDTMSGAILVKDIDFTYSNLQYGTILTIPRSIKLITFVRTATEGKSLTFVGHRECTFEGLQTGLGLAYDHEVVLENFYKVKKCKGSSLHISNCHIVEECTAFNVNNCDYVDHFHAFTESGQSFMGDCSIEYCKCVTGVEVGADDEEYPIIDLRNCEFVSNVYGSGIVHYVNCKHVDGDTCKDYYTTEEANNIQLITTDGSKKSIPLSNYEEGRSIPTKNAYGQIELSYEEPLSPIEAAPKWYVDDAIGDISTILTALHEGGIS